MGISFKLSFIFFYGIVFLLILQFFLMIFHVPNYVFPTPYAIFITFIHSFPILWTNALYTFIEAFLGILLAFCLSIFIGGGMIYYQWLAKGIYPFIFLFQMIPLVGIGPIIVFWFGFGLFPKIATVALFALYPMFVAFLSGLKEIPQGMLNLFTLLRASQIQTFVHLIYPYCLRFSFKGIKIAVTYSITSATVVELLGSEKGLGILLTRAAASYNIEMMFAGISMIIILTGILYALSSFLEKKYVRG